MATTTKPMAKTTKATEKKRAPRSASRKSAENGDQKKHYRPAPSLPMQNEVTLVTFTHQSLVVQYVF